MTLGLRGVLSGFTVYRVPQYCATVLCTQHTVYAHLKNEHDDMRISTWLTRDSVVSYPGPFHNNSTII